MDKSRSKAHILGHSPNWVEEVSGSLVILVVMPLRLRSPHRWKGSYELIINVSVVHLFESGLDLTKATFHNLHHIKHMLYR